MPDDVKIKILLCDIIFFVIERERWHIVLYTLNEF